MDKSTQIDQLIRDRKSIYPVQFNGEIIDDAIVERLLENANLAPTHRFTQPWRFIVHSGEGMRKLVAEMEAIYRKNTPAEKVQEMKIQKMRAMPETTSHVIAIGMKRQESESLPEIEEIAAVACAVENLYLSVAAYGLAGYWSTGGGTYTDDMKQYLGLGEKDRCMGFFYLGKTDLVDLPAKKKAPVSERITWVRA